MRGRLRLNEETERLCLPSRCSVLQHWSLQLINKTHAAVGAQRRRRSSGVNDRPLSGPSLLPRPSVQILLLFSQETGSCPLPGPAHRITSCSLSGGGRLFVLERLPPKQKPEDPVTRGALGACTLRLDPRQEPDELSDHIWIWCHLHCQPAVTQRPISITGCCEGGGLTCCMATHPPALVAPVHDLKLLPQPPAHGGKETRGWTQIITQVQNRSHTFQVVQLKVVDWIRVLDHLWIWVIRSRGQLMHCGTQHLL